VLKNKYDFNEMTKNNIFAMCFGSGVEGHCYDFQDHPHYKEILVKTNLQHFQNFQNKPNVCWCNSFILHKSKILDFMELVKDLIVTNRHDSECSERYLDVIMFYLNGKKRCAFNNYVNVSYSQFNVNIVNDIVLEYFAKRSQQKTEHTLDI